MTVQGSSLAQHAGAAALGVSGGVPPTPRRLLGSLICFCPETVCGSEKAGAGSGRAGTRTDHRPPYPPFSKMTFRS